METPQDLLHRLVFSALESAGIMYEAIPCEPDLADTAAFCNTYGYGIDESANTILVVSKGQIPQFAACVVLANTKLDVNKSVRMVMGVKKASFASAESTIKLSGMEIGGVTIAGLQNMPIYIDSAVMERPRVIIGGGNRTSKVILDPVELKKLPGIIVVEGLAKPKESA